MGSFSIQHPLLVFFRVHRRTGTIERRCVFLNQKPEPVELEVRFDFAEHSWVQIYGADRNGTGGSNGRGLLLKPGENEVLLSFNTNNFHFPDARFKGRISFHDLEDTSSRDSIEINFEHIDDLRPFTGYAAIDLGTSTSTLSLFHIHDDAVRRAPRTPRLDAGEENIPSAVFIRHLEKFIHQADGGCVIGSEAVRSFLAGTTRDPRCLQLSTKRLLGMSRVLVADERESGGFVDSLLILQALGRFVRERAQGHDDVHALINRVSVTFPPTWNYQLISRWREVFKRIGFREQDLDLSLDEASAAGLFYIYNCVRDRDALNGLIQDLLHTAEAISDERLPADESVGKRYTLNLLSFDFGGGTMDLALIEATLEIFPHTVRLRLALLGSDSLAYGGDQVTLAIFRILKRRLAMALCDPARMEEERLGKKQEPAPVHPATSWIGGALSTPGSGDEEGFVLPDRSHAAPPWNPGFTSGDGHDTNRLEASRQILHQNWGYLDAHIHDETLEAGLEDAVEAIFPTRFLPSSTEMFRVEARHNFDWLWPRAEALKKKLFEEVRRLRGSDEFPRFDGLGQVVQGITLDEFPGRGLLESVSWSGDETTCQRIVSVNASEVFQAISAHLESGLAKARRLAGERHLDRVVLSGQSSRIPMIRWMFSRPRAEGGLGIPPAKIEFDEDNAKAAVSKGACLLHVMRDTLVGFEVDIADFTANLLADLFYLQVDGSRRVLFRAGAIDDFSFVEETPDPRTFPKYLSVFLGSEDELIGQFLLEDPGESLPTVDPRRTAPGEEAESNGRVPAHPELMEIRRRDRSAYARWAASILRWSEKERIAWMESSATPGTRDAPRYRYYLTRNHSLYVVRDTGEETRGSDGSIRPSRSLLELVVSEPGDFGLNPRDNPFSGIH